MSDKPAYNGPVIPIDLRIAAFRREADARGKPIIRYFLEDQYGDPVGAFVTPVTSRLSELLLSHARRNRVR